MSQHYSEYYTIILLWAKKISQQRLVLMRTVKMSKTVSRGHGKKIGQLVMDKITLQIILPILWSERQFFLCNVPGGTNWRTGYGTTESNQSIIMPKSHETACTIVLKELFTAVYCSSEQNLHPWEQLGKDTGQANSMKIMTVRNDKAQQVPKVYP